MGKAGLIGNEISLADKDMIELERETGWGMREWGIE